MLEIKPKQLDVEQIKHFIEIGKKLRLGEGKQEGRSLAYQLDAKVRDIDISVEIKPDFKENSASIIASDNFDFENKVHMELVEFAVAIAKLWDMQRYTVGKLGR